MASWVALRVSGYELRVACYELRVTGCGLRVSDSEDTDIHRVTRVTRNS